MCGILVAMTRGIGNDVMFLANIFFKTSHFKLNKLSIPDVHKRWGQGEVHMELILIGTIPAWQYLECGLAGVNRINLLRVGWG